MILRIRVLMRLLIFTLINGCSPDQDTIKNNSRISLHDKFFHGHVEFAYTSRGFRVNLYDSLNHKLDQAIFNYQPYRFGTSDVDRDGRTDILVGLIKTTEFDPHEKKRLFILRVDDGQIRPLWLGSKVCQQLIDFKASADGVVKTIEKTKTGNYAIGHYKWQGFGLTLIEYVSNEKPYDEAITLFNA